MKKNEYHHGNLKEEFLRIAFEFIKKEDIDKLTLKILSDETATSRSAIYRHFSSKDELIETMIKQGFKQFDDAVAPILRRLDKPLVDRFYLSGKYYLAFASHNPNLYRLLFGKKYARIREEIMSLKDDDCHGFGALKIAIEEGQRNGILKKDNSYNQAIVIWSSLHGLSSLVIDGFMDVEQMYEKLYEDMFQSLLAGIITNKVKLLTTLPFMNKLSKL